MRSPKHSSGFRLGIVNPTTLVGNEIKTILRERAFPYQKIALLDSTGTGSGSLTDVDDEPAFVTAASAEELEDLDLVFFCGPPAGNREWIRQADDREFTVIDVSQPTTIEGGKLAVAGVNLDEVTEADRLIVSPHPVAIPIAIILHQIETLTPIDICTATVIQPASEFEQEGVEELARQTISVLNVQSVPKEIFDRQLAFNLYPALERNEEFIIGQIREMLQRKLDVALLVTQGTIFHGHTFSLFIRTRERLDAAAIAKALGSSSAIALPEGDETIGTIDAAGKDEVLVAEIRPDPAIRGGFWVWAVCDNLRRSSALNAVLVAEKALFGTGTAH
ncbi:MAG TPA: Asd/ArgC dimerization domain-containing protein [Thermoanaerobaculia bacterium]|nr:Asd/ArgC dimerization domain-containing protein [Thermoanaerobaculia bacterium]